MLVPRKSPAIVLVKYKAYRSLIDYFSLSEMITSEI